VFVLLLCVRVLQVSPQVQGLRALHGGTAAGASGTGPRCTPVLNPAEHLRFSLGVFSYSVRRQSPAVRVRFLSVRDFLVVC
jgi:hypothetical protein